MGPSAGLEPATWEVEAPCSIPLSYEGKMAIEITANRQEEEPDRIVRLKRVADALAAVTGIAALHDHKGTLYVNWARQPSTTELRRVLSAWSAENEVHSNHAINGQPLLWDEGGYNPFRGAPFP